MSRYFDELAAAFIRGRLRNPAATLEDGAKAGLRLHKFKADARLPRVERVLGILRGIGPQRLLDVGSGRGTFLWPLLATFPDLTVTAIDVKEQRAADIAAVSAGGIDRLTVVRMNAEQMAFAPHTFDVVTMLEVLEHMPNPAAAMKCALATATQFVIVSVPSVPDDNPEHIHLFTPRQLQEMAVNVGATRVTIEHVLNHRIAIIRVAP